MTSTRWMFRSALALIGSAALFGCMGSSPVPPTAVSSVAVDEDVTTDLDEHDRHHHQGGVTMLIALSVDTLGLPPAQQAAVATIQSDLFLKLEPARAAEQGVLNALADGIAAGTVVDKARVDGAIAALEAASAQVHLASADALNQLHAALTPPQRAALVDKVRANWVVFQRANGVGDQVGKEHGGGRLAALAAELDLTPDQVARMRMSLEVTTQAPVGSSDPAEIDAHLQRLSAFRDEAFDAKTLAEGATVDAHLASRGAAGMVRFYEAIAPVLTPDQRTKLSALIREHASHKDAAFVATH